MQRTILTAAAIISAAATLTIAPAQAQVRGAPLPAPGTVECQQQVNNSRLVGGLVGAGIGALAGRSVAGRGVRSEGGVLGAVAGAAVGSEVGRRRVACDDGRFNQRYGGPVYQDGYRQPASYGYPQQGSYGYPQQGGYGHAQPVSHRAQACGWGETQVRQPDGRTQRQQVWMCQAGDGNWYPAQ